MNLKTISIKIITLICVSLLIVSEIFAASGKSGTKVAEFVTLGAGGRPLAMGGAYSAMIGDIFSIYYNPAGLADLNDLQIGLMHNRLPADISQNNISFGFPLKKEKNYMAVSLVMGNYGSEEITVYPNDNAGNPKTGSKFDGSDLMFILSYAFLNIDDVRFGFNLKYVSQDIYQYRASAIVLDAGVIYRIFEFADIAAVISNIGARFKYKTINEELPIHIRGGLSLRPIDKLILNGELIYNKDEDIDMIAAAEYRLLKSFALRAGFNTINDAGAGITFGLGFNFNDLNIDYVYEPYGDFDASHKMSVDFKFGKQTPLSKHSKKRIFTKSSAKAREIDFNEFIKEGYSFTVEGKYLNALISFKNALELNEFDISARLWLAYIYKKMGNRSEAVKEYQRVLQIEPTNVNAAQALKLLGE